MRHLAVALLAAAALAVSVYALASRPTLGTTDLGAQAEQYIQVLAQQNGLTVDKQQVLSVRTTGDDSVVRVRIRYHAVMFGIKGPEASATLVVHLHRSLWNVTAANVA